jgi:hypothetical protein
MLFFPYERLTLETSLTVNEVVAALSGYVEPKRFWRNPFSRDHKDYQGLVSAEGFKMSRIIHHRNSFLPVIKGRMHPMTRGARVEVTMSLHPFIAAFWVLWLAILGSGSLTGGAAWLASPRDALRLAPVAMFAFGYLLCTLSFKWESRKERQFLLELLDGRLMP